MKTNTTIRKYFLTTFSLVILISATTIPLHGAQLTLSSESTDSDMIIEMTLDEVEKLAGMKLALDYPKDSLLVKKTKKSSKLNSFMHVVNDKNPGKLIIVLASATGVSGKNLKLFEITFTPIKDGKVDAVVLKPTECQLMSESLKTIPCTTTPLTVTAKQ